MKSAPALLVHLPLALREVIKSEARKRGVSMASLVRQAVMAHLEVSPDLLSRGDEAQPDA